MKVKFLNMILDKKNKVFNFFFGFAISCLLLYYSIKEFDLNNFKEVINNTDFSLIFLSSLILIFTVYLRALRWKLLLKHKASNNFLYKAQLVGYFGNNILPFRIGELIKSYIVGEKYNVSKSMIFGSIVLERILDMFVVGCFVLLIFFINSNFLYNINTSILIGLFLIVIIGLFGVILSFKKNNFKVKNSSKILLIVNDIYSGFSNLNNKNFIFSILYSLLIWCLYLLQVFLMQNAFSLDLSLNQSLILLVISTAAISIPALPGNFGTFEGSVVYSLSLFNVVDNFGFAFILHAVSFIPYTILGLFYFVENFKFFNYKFNLYE